MKKYLALAAIIMITSLFLVGCGKEFVCNPPYMQIGETCCLDKDSNGVCDKDEVVKQVIEEMPIPEDEELEEEAPEVEEEEEETEPETTDDEEEEEEEPEATDEDEEDEEEEEDDSTSTSDWSASTSGGVSYEKPKELQKTTLKKESSVDCEGDAYIMQRSDGSYYLEFKDFKTKSAPKLYAYLSSKSNVRKTGDLILESKTTKSKNAYKLEPKISRYDAISMKFDIPSEVSLSEYDLIVVADTMFNKIHCTGKFS
ncbi:hypothetical protein HN419_02660 [Candidatus Woesearchaeota archaeon]|jgi:hypothetical protein|nr:hypothetical protein [Candidatus Woesearchaeota archaeon]MBT3537101.1 hypothetical protein [Candidatus Woesearchaeota archaeon]MBT4697210.1 hypothetical protein [Candidatus Woesearchaeota archaeon]MBT4716450.1 hypothetical protein [Candidatus Woesearchaeota archaeon]MBT7106589.1 hypothetical protein [Candidatus Woesearchaeota archaeon]